MRRLVKSKQVILRIKKPIENERNVKESDSAAGIAQP
jgi:hypothetical protein